ncbi:MAG: hypothetical protein L0Z62_49240 [Gemmataceae bacterium]|nr:hypothetical protein [Gemmataceae bacterium]
MSHTPQAMNLLLCEQLIVDVRTNDPTLVNCFTRLWVRHIPSEPVSFVVVAFLTGG